MRFWAPFEVLNVDMDKDPIQTAEDLFAHIFEIAEKVKTDYCIYCLKTHTMSALNVPCAHLRNIFGCSMICAHLWNIRYLGKGMSSTGGKIFSSVIISSIHSISLITYLIPVTKSLTLLASGEIFCHWSKFCDKKLWHFPSLVNFCESSLWRWELFRLFIPILPEIFVPGGGKKMGDICTWRRTIKR